MHCENGAFPGIDTDGGFAHFLKTNARAVVKLEPTLEPQDIAALADAGLTAYHTVRRARDLLPPGSRVVVIGAGGLGHIGIQCLKALTPAEVIVVDPSEPALGLARQLGADRTETEPLEDDEGAEVVIDFVAEKGTTSEGIGMTGDGGSYFVVGYGENVDVPAIELISREISVVGNLVGNYTDLQELMTLTAQGKVRLETTTYPLDGINDALADLDAGRLQGRGILIPG
jgi:NAD+-dependent secondary alcohol dehydrogenase Adh1